MRQQKVIRTLNQGVIFGEVALIFSCMSTTSVISQNYTTLAYLTLKSFLELWEYSPDTFYMIKSQALSYEDDPWINFKIKMLEQVDYF